MPWYEYRKKGKLYYTVETEEYNEYQVLSNNSDESVAEFLTKNQDAHLLRARPNIAVIETKKANSNPVELPSGYYYHLPDRGYKEPEMLRQQEVRKDAYVEIASQQDIPRDEIKRFVADKNRYKELGIIHKRGLLLYGPPGEGKTSLIRNLLEKAVPKESIIITLDYIPSREFIQTLSNETGERLKIFIFEEFATLASDPNHMSDVLDFLDGAKSVQHSLVIATTNYPEMIPGNIVDRPSRFDRLLKFGHPDQRGIKALLKNFLKREITEEEVQFSLGKSAAAIKEACIQSLSKNLSLKEIFDQIQKQSDLVKSDFAEKRKLGFN